MEITGATRVSLLGERTMTDYHINVFYSERHGGYIADILDLRFCSAFGETPEEALHEVLIAKEGWRLIAVGKCGQDLIMVPYETEEGLIRPVTAHVTARAQIDARIRSGRFYFE
jgi:hypothetical protein